MKPFTQTLLTPSEFLHGVCFCCFCFLIPPRANLIRHKLPSTDTKAQTIFFFYILIWTLPLSNSIHRACTLAPASSPLQSRLIFPSWQREQKCNRADGKRDIREGKRYPWGPHCRSFPLLGFAVGFFFVCSVFFSSGELFCFPSEACLVHNLRPCNADPGPQW